MATVNYSVEFVTDEIKKKLPKSWSVFHFVSAPNKWSYSRGMKQVALMYRQSPGRGFLFKVSARNTLPRFKELAKIAEKYGYKVTIEVL
jgi:hypothetical protein